ncbi:MAG TPA: hypothetical protein VFT53_07295 [Candidatus Saccharimonadales bacterium]|nr:hypothetical protein [Candidatus Saccharimonadales bacterium]
MELREQGSSATPVQTAANQAAGAVDLRHIATGDGPQLSSNPQLADDADMIEDEWIAIAKRVVDQYKDDPYSLTRAIAMLRADYLKKRYNKETTIAD